MNERIKDLRYRLNITLEAFGSKIGLTKGAVSNIEKGRANPSDRTIAAICREFGVNEQWLRTGRGEMFLSSALPELYHEPGQDPETFQHALLEALAQVGPDGLEHVEQFINALVERAERRKGQPCRENISDTEVKFVFWFRSLAPELRHAILTLAGAPKELFLLVQDKTTDPN